MASVLISEDGDLRDAESALKPEMVLRGEVEDGEANSDVSDDASEVEIFMRSVGYGRGPDISELAKEMAGRRRQKGKKQTSVS